jgi:hypothetical protein
MVTINDSVNIKRFRYGSSKQNQKFANNCYNINNYNDEFTNDRHNTPFEC